MAVLGRFFGGLSRVSCLVASAMCSFLGRFCPLLSLLLQKPNPFLIGYKTRIIVMEEEERRDVLELGPWSVLRCMIVASST